MDVRFALPFYYRGELFCWLQNTGHWPDIGGMVPGGFSAQATEVEQEGLRLPPVKLFKRGVMDAEIFAIICSNMRIADQRIGDIKAQAAALKVGERRLTELIDRYGRDVVVAGHRRDAHARGTADARAHRRHSRRRLSLGGVRRLRRRRQRAAEDRAHRHQVRRDAELRFHGLLAALPRADELGAWRPPIRPSTSPCATSSPISPLNSGAFEPLQIKRPEGTFLDARYPRPVSGCAAEVSQRIAEAVFLALVQAIPDKVTAAPAGSSGNFALGGFDPAKGARLRHVPDLRRRLRRQRRPRRPHQRLLHHRHLQEPAGGGAGAVLSRSCSAALPCARARAAPARSAAASACTTRWSCCAARRAPRS